MPTTDCPECGYHLAHTTGTTVVGEEAVYQFRCPKCEYEWTNPIL